MSTYFTVCLLLFSILFKQSLTVTTTQSPNSDVDDYLAFIDTGVRDDFDFQLLKNYLGTEFKNVIVSPISLKIVLALLYEGAGGTTEHELKTVLNFNANKTVVRQEYTHIIESLLNVKKINCEDSSHTKTSEFTLNLGTRIYLDSDVQPQQQFQSKACESYQTKIESTNFTDAEQASNSINSWVDKLTDGRITRLVHESDVANAVLLVANAMYFKGTWRHQFPRNQTHTGGFYLAPNKVATVEYMATTDYFFFTDSKELDAKLIRIPYKGKQFAMIILLPNAKAGLPRLIQNLNSQALKNHINLMDKMTVDLILPKFKFDFQSRMSTILKNMGLQAMFQNSASFPGITRGNSIKLAVSDIVQKSGIEVNEEGSIAYAATEVVIGNKFGDAQISFNATHPFLFFIEDQKTHTILFIGKVENPLEENAIPLPSRFGELAPMSSDSTGVPLSSVTSQTPIFQLNPGSWSEQDEALAKRFNYFDLELLREVSRTDENVFISPASIKATLGMVLEGSKGLSAEEISKTLRLPLNQNDARNQLKPLLYNPSENNSPNSVLESANAIFISNKLVAYDNYRRLIEQYYGGFMRSVNFSDVQSASNLINAWVNNSTRGLIPKLVGPENLSSRSSIILTNALYFKGLWKKSFDEKSTLVKCFHLPSRQCQDSYMMQATDVFNYRFIEEIDAHALEIPYGGDKYAMLIILPRVKNNIQALTRDLQHASFGAIIDKLEPTEVVLELPRFDIEYTHDMIPPLKELGIREVFGENADLSGIIQNERVSINNVVHKTKIEVNERGTVAAAVTAAIVIPLMGSSNPRVVADHPFAFFIYKKENRNIIFEGIVNKPTQPRATPVVNRSNFNYVQNTAPQVPQQQQQYQQQQFQQQQQQQYQQTAYQQQQQQQNYNNNQRPLSARAAFGRY